MRNGRATPAEPATESPMPQDSTTTHEPVLSPEWSRDRSVVEQAGYDRRSICQEGPQILFKRERPAYIAPATGKSS